MSFASPYPDVHIPRVSVYDYLFGDVAAADLGRVALIDAATGDTVTYRELIARINAAARALAAWGIGPGDVVALLAPNSPEFAIAFHAILRAGATATTMNVLFTAKDISAQLTDSRARLLITVDSLLGVAADGANHAGLASGRIVLLDRIAEADRSHLGQDQLCAAGAARTRDVDPAAQLAVLPYSSGTTARPKGVMLTHRNLVANVAQLRPIHQISAEDVILAVLPFFHIYGMTVLLNAAVHARATLVILPAFNLGEYLTALQTYRCTLAFIAPPVAVALAKHPAVDSYDTSSLRVVMSGAAPLDQDLGQRVARRLGCRVVQGYGMSELSPVSHCMPFDGRNPSGGPPAPLSSCGWTVPNAVSKIVDPDTGAEIGVPDHGRSAAGELWVKGPNVMAGYLNNEAGTADTIDSEGFLRTGDLASVDSNGCVYILDRLKELIKYKGYQVPPAELEALLLTHPDIADAAVIGAVDTDTGEEVPKAFVVTQPHASLSEKAVMDFVAANVAPYKKIRLVQFIETIPKSPSGKILRKDLRQRA